MKKRKLRKSERKTLLAVEKKLQRLVRREKELERRNPVLKPKSMNGIRHWKKLTVNRGDILDKVSSTESW